MAGRAALTAPLESSLIATDPPPMRVLTLNAGSSTLKAHLVAGDRVAARATAEWTATNRPEVLAAVLAEVGLPAAPGQRGVAQPPLTRPAGSATVPEIDAIAHRVVHGGERFREHGVVDDATLDAIDSLGALAPLHNRAAVETIRAVRAALPGVPNVACFDTVFHATMPPISRREPIPSAWDALGIRRFGFHGLSVQWSVGRAAELLGRPESRLGLVVAHLGGGASVTAVDGGRSMWCSMGWTPNDGMMMATRSGGLDPAIVTAMLRHGPLSHAGIEALEQALERDAGLQGVSGRSGDVRELAAAAAAGDEASRLALDVFAARAAAAVAAAATWLSRVDAIVFTGGIGEHAGSVRAAIVRRLAVLGAHAVDDEERGTDRVLSPGPPAILRVEAREELVMARAAAELLGRGAG